MIHQIKMDSELYRQAADLRYELFFKKHGLPKEITFDDKESASKHMVISDGDILVAYGRLTVLSYNNFQISQMVVSPKYQNQGYGSTLLSELITTAVNNGAKNITLNARVSALGLYRKYEFIKNGDVFLSRSTSVPHINMQRKICR